MFGLTFLISRQRWSIFHKLIDRQKVLFTLIHPKWIWLKRFESFRASRAYRSSIWTNVFDVGRPLLDLFGKSVPNNFFLSFSRLQQRPNSDAYLYFGCFFFIWNLVIHIFNHKMIRIIRIIHNSNRDFFTVIRWIHLLIAISLLIAVVLTSTFHLFQRAT